MGPQRARQSRQQRQSAVSIATGSFHVHALRDDGLLFSWGNNNLGSLGNNDDTPLALVPVVVGGF